jgi:hypothetical protein
MFLLGFLWARQVGTQAKDAYVYNGEVVFGVQSYPWMWPRCGYPTHGVYPCVKGLAIQMRPAAGWTDGAWHTVTRFGPEVGPGINGVTLVRQMKHEKTVYRLAALVIPAPDPSAEIIVPLADVSVDVRKRQ